MSKAYIFSSVFALILGTGGALLGCSSGLTPAQTTSTEPASAPANDDVDLAPVLERYEKGLNEADVEVILALYSQDAVFMAQHREPSIGSDAIREAYSQVFQQIRLNIDFEIDEMVKVSDTIAYARTRSRGTVQPVGTELEIPESNQELFLFEREDVHNPWLISRYIFSTMNPPPAPCAPHTEKEEQ